MHKYLGEVRAQPNKEGKTVSILKAGAGKNGGFADIPRVQQHGRKPKRGLGPSQERSTQRTERTRVHRCDSTGGTDTQE